MAISPMRRGGAQLAAIAGLAVGVGFLVRVSAVDVMLQVDGSPVPVVTHAGTVAELLLEQRVDVDSGDLVLPGPAARLSDGMAVTVQRARPVTVRADSRSVALRSHGRSALAVLQEAGVSLQPGDVVEINGEAWPVDRPAPLVPTLSPPRAPRRGVSLLAISPDWVRPPRGVGPAVVVTNTEVALLPGEAPSWTVEVFRAADVVVVDEGVPYSVRMAGETVGDALAAAGVPLDVADRVSPPRDAPFPGVQEIAIERATPFFIETNGTQRSVRALARTVGEGLAAAGVNLGDRDYAEPTADAPLEAGMTIRVVRVAQEVIEREVDIPFGTVTEPDPDRELDDTIVVQAGVPGRKAQRLLVTYENGEEIDRQVTEETVLQEPVTQVVRYGTRIVWRTIDTPEGPKRYWRKLRVYATSYSLSRSGTPKSAPWYGYTRSGMPMRKGIVGINPRVINWLSNLYVPDYGIGLAADTGGGIGLYHIDLGYDDDNYQSWHWWVDAYLLEPLPPADEMKWILP